MFVSVNNVGLVGSVSSASLVDFAVWLLVLDVKLAMALPIVLPARAMKLLVAMVVKPTKFNGTAAKATIKAGTLASPPIIKLIVSEFVFGVSVFLMPRYSLMLATMLSRGRVTKRLGISLSGDQSCLVLT